MKYQSQGTTTLTSEHWNHETQLQQFKCAGYQIGGKNIYDKLTILGEQSHEQSIQDKLQLTKSADHFIRKLPITAGCQLPANTVAEMSKLLPAVQLWLVSSPEQYKKHHINCQKSQDTQHICNLSYRYNHTHTHTFNGPSSGTIRVSRYQKGKTNLDFTEARQWVAVASAGPYASLHLEPDR